MELVDMVTERVTRYCMKYGIAMVVVSHCDSFERYFRRIGREVWVVEVDGG